VVAWFLLDECEKAAGISSANAIDLHTRLANVMNASNPISASA
jgi:hypothetical protein